MAENVGGIFYTVSADTKPLIDQTRIVDRETAKMAASFNAITAAVKILAVAMTLIKASQMADEMRLLGARVEVAAGSVEKAAAAMRELQSISIRTQTSVAANVQVFTRLNQSLLQMGGTQADTLRLTELLGMAIKVSGASATESASAMLQFGQALGSGKLAGDELRSLLENAPYLMRQLADGLGVPIGALKKLGEEGKLTADVVVSAMQRAASQIERDFAKMPQTLGAAFTTAVDALQRLIEKADDFSGSSAAMTGAARGTAEAFDGLAIQIGNTTGAADALGRNAAVKTWSEQTREALSYVADAADVTWQTLSTLGRNVGFVFTSMGREIGGIGAQIAAVLRGDFEGASNIGSMIKADAEAARKALDEADAKTLSGRQTWGVKMRQAWAAAAMGTDGSDPMDRKARGDGGAPSKLTPPAAGGDGKGKKGKAESEAEIRARQDLARMARVDAAEQQADRDAEAKAEKDAAAEDRAAQDRARGRTFAQDTAVAGDPIAQLQLELQRKRELLDQYAAADMENLLLYSQAKVALEQQTAEKIAAIVQAAEDKKAAAQQQALQGYSSLFGSMADIQKTFAGEQDGVYRALFAASKAFAIAEAIVKIQAGIANASALPFPANLGAMATVAAQTAGIVSTIRGTSYGGGRQYGGPASTGSLYRVNETGKPEMFTAANGSQYILPTQSGRVTAADKVGGGSKPQVFNDFSVRIQGDASEDTIQLIKASQAQFAARLAEQGIY